MKRRTFLKAAGLAGFVGGNVAVFYYLHNKRRDRAEGLNPQIAQDPPVKDDHICSMAFSLHGDRLVSAGADDVLSIWDPTTSNRLFSGPARHGLSVTSVGFLGEDSWLATADQTRIVKFWRPGQSRESTYVQLESNPTCFAFSPKSTGGITPPPAVAVVGLDDYSIRVLAYEVNGHWPFAVRLTKREITSLPSGSDMRTAFLELGLMQGHKSRVNALAFSPDGSILASGSDDKTIRFWDTYTWEETANLVGHDAGINSVTFSHDGSRMASASADGRIVIWDVRTKSQVAGLRVHTAPVLKVVFVQDSNWIASICVDKMARIWHLGNGIQEGLQLPATPSKYAAVDVSADGRYLASSWGKDVKFWSTLELLSEARRNLRIT